MKLWKRDTKQWTVRQVDGEPYPGRDGEGEMCHSNTHFEKEASAWESLIAEAEAWVELSGGSVADAKCRLARAQEDAGEAAIAFKTAKWNRLKRNISQNVEDRHGDLSINSNKN